ncbi:MAG: hypothetical protein JJ975_17595 [Bacteroidia bacterium]|nr:hypothetical protein [Bacteroidia bacterium]
MACRKLLILTLLFTCGMHATTRAQNVYYAGLEIGPKFDQYRLASGGNRPYSPSLSVSNQMAATFGILGGVKLEDRLLIEAGIYKSDYRVHIDVINEDGQRYFENTPINTFTSLMIPFNFNFIKTKQGKYEPQHLIIGTGFTLLANTKLGITETFVSPEILVDPFDVSKGTISYTVSNNQFDAKIFMLNLNLGYQYPINDFVNINVSMNTKLGVAGNNYFDITHRTPDHAQVRNSVFTSGTSIQFNIGFRYFFIEYVED